MGASRCFLQTAGRRLRSRIGNNDLAYRHQRCNQLSLSYFCSGTSPAVAMRSQPQLFPRRSKSTWRNQPYESLVTCLRSFSCPSSTTSNDHDEEVENSSCASTGISSKSSSASPSLVGKLVVTPTPHGGWKVELLLSPQLYHYHRQQHRYLSSQSSSEESGQGNSEGVAGSVENGASSTSNDYDKYSSAASDDRRAPGNSSNSETTGTDTTSTMAAANLASKEAQLRERRRQVRVYYPYNDKDIRRTQARRKEKALAHTVANVNRALMGNVIIAASKLFAWSCSQSSSMMSEFIHSVVDCANQYLLLRGLRDSSNVADRKHPYGYGKSVYFWALVSALGTFFMGFGVSMTHSWGELMNPSLHEIGPEVWGVLTFSFLVDGYVLFKTITEVRGAVPEGSSFLIHVKNMRDPATLAILLEDGAACFGVLLAIAGTSLAHSTGNPIFDGLAGVSISVLLGTMGYILARVNHRFLLGQAVDKDITDGIERILKSRRSIDAVHSVQSQWTGPDTFSYKAEVGFDGTFLAAKLMPTHEKEFLAIRDSMSKELPLVLSWYAEDVIRTVEREVQIIEALIRKQYPAAEFIELEPMSKDFDQYAIDDGFEKDLRRLESENLDKLRRLIPSLDQFDVEGKAGLGPLEDPLDKKPTQ